MGVFILFETKYYFFRYNIMNIVNPNNSRHELNIIHRYDPFRVVLELYNEESQISTIVPNWFTILNGYMIISFDYTFIDGQKFQIKITDDEQVVYRGKLMATTQDPQTFKASKDLYYYE